ncbi:thioredoxin family protein [Pedobacter sp. UC225_61]|uniref:thioredoxin family protein n=1 Tax=Pedobacter sp. UC225_61 TaxID=3374623 RepID=UPI003797FD33
MLAKIYHLFLLGALLSLSSFSTFNSPIVKNKRISFIEHTFSIALKKAKAERKFIFVDAYATWCGPCRQLKVTTFKDAKVADFFNTNFVNVGLDMEKGEGINLALKWDVQEYPTLLILDYNGKVVFRSIGYLNAKQLIDFGKQVLK